MKSGAAAAPQRGQARDRAGVPRPVQRGRRLRRGVPRGARRLLACRGNQVMAVIVAARRRQGLEPGGAARGMVTRRHSAGGGALRRMTGEETGVEQDRRGGDRRGHDNDCSAKLHGALIIAIAAAAGPADYNAAEVQPC